MTKKTTHGNNSEFVDVALQYIDDVLDGRVLACEYVVQACRRQREDLNREGFGYVFDSERADRVCKFIELLPHIKGE